jgi:cytochrome c556
MTLRNAVAAAVLMGFGLAGAAGLAHAEITSAEALSARQAGMKANGKDAGDIKKGIEAGGDLTALAPKAGEIAAFAAKFPGLFPPGSDQGKTRALPAIWTDKADFDKHAADLASSATKLQAALAANDAAAAKAAFGATGAVCGACHRAYRAPA